MLRMTLEEKVGQVVQADLDSVTPEDVRKYRLGSVLAGGNSDPGKRYNAPAADWLAAADAFHAASMDTAGDHAAIPLLLGIDAVHGHNNVVGATLFPHNIGLGAANDPDLVGRIARATALELRATGFEWTFAPTVTVPRDDRWGRAYEGYSEDPALVSRY
ncbi:MAG: glycoside hydrolase family 3 protein, partial [Arenimonas sp.]|nr:glycoside hydrolase family 3 protein [Arenimonas sp.]